MKINFDDSWFRGSDLKFSFIIYHFSQFLPSIYHPIWSISKKTLEISLFPCGFDLYLPLYPSIRIIFIKLVSLELFLTRDRVKSMTSPYRLTICVFQRRKFSLVSLIGTWRPTEWAAIDDDMVIALFRSFFMISDGESAIAEILLSRWLWYHEKNLGV